MKKLIQILCFLSITQFSFAQSNTEQLVNKLVEEYRQNPASVIQKYTPDDFVFITAEGAFWDKNRAIQSVSASKLEEITISNQKIKTYGDIVIVTGINTSRWSRGTMTINYKDAFTYIHQIKGNEIKWLSAQHSLVTPKDRNKALFREMQQLANERKLIDFSKYYADSYEVKGLGKGSKAAEAVRDNYLKTFPDLTIKIIEVIAEGDLVFARCEATGTQKGEMNGIPPTGKTGTVAHWTINRYNSEGKIVEAWNLNDNLSMMQQLGVLK